MEKLISLQLDSQVSQVCDIKSKCDVCKGLDDPTIVVISQLKDQSNFIKLICNLCLIGHFNSSHLITLSQLSTAQNSKMTQQLENVSTCQSSIQQITQKKEENHEAPIDKPLKDILNSNKEQQNQQEQEEDEDDFDDQKEEEQQEQEQEQEEGQEQQQEDGNSKEQSIISDTAQECGKIECIPAFKIESHHIQIEFNEFIAQFEASLKKQRFELLHKSTGLQLFLKDALRTIYEIQASVDNIQEGIKKSTCIAEDKINQLKGADDSITKQRLLSEMMSLVNLENKTVTVEVQQQKFTQEISEIECKLEFLSEILQPELFGINSRIYALKKETLERCNQMLLQLKIQMRWKQYTDISMDQETMVPGMRGVYRYNISSNGKVSKGTNTGYVYLAMDTTESYHQYYFTNVIPLNQSKYNSYSNPLSRDPLAHSLQEYFMNQRSIILQQYSLISRLIQ